MKQLTQMTGTSLAVAAVLFVPEARSQFYIGAEGGWLDRVVDKIGDRIEQQIPIADHIHPITRREL